MLITDKFVFLHLHKSGGTFVNQFLRKYYPSSRMVGYHFPYSFLPDQYSHLPVFALVRNPWAYYVSWYSFQKKMRRPNILFKCVTNDNRLDFKASITNLLNLSEDQQRVDFLAKNFPKDFSNQGINLTQSCIEKIRFKNIGFYSFLYQRLLLGCERVIVGKMETMRQDLMNFLISIDAQPTTQAEEVLMTSKKVNISQHGQYQDYYDQELSALVASKDSMVIDRYGYQLNLNDL